MALTDWQKAVNAATNDRSTIWLWCNRFPILGEDEVLVSDNGRCEGSGLRVFQNAQLHKRPGISAEAMAWAEEQGLEFFARINAEHHVGALIRARNPDEEFLIKLRWW